MPRHKTVPPEPSIRDHRDVIDALAAELRADGGGAQPLILEREVPATNSRDVTVVWDRWGAVPTHLRGWVIHAAYERAEGVAAAEAVAVAVGVTPAEAVALGMMPFAVVPIPRAGAAEPPPSTAKAVRAEVGRTVFGPRGKELRYARLEDAVEAVGRLTAAVPGSVWAIKEYVPVES